MQTLKVPPLTKFICQVEERRDPKSNIARGTRELADVLIGVRGDKDRGAHKPIFGFRWVADWALGIENRLRTVVR